MQAIIFIHGLESSGKGFKGRFFKTVFPDILTPDFKKFDPNITIYHLLKERMKQLNLILNKRKPWIVIGSSFGGLMGAIYTLKNPDKVIHLILLAPFLRSRKLKPSRYKSIDVPVTIYHGINDKVVPYKPSKERAEELFNNLNYNLVNDDHFLHHTVVNIDWHDLI